MCRRSPGIIFMLSAHLCSSVVGSAPVDRTKTMGVRAIVSGKISSSRHCGGNWKFLPCSSPTYCAILAHSFSCLKILTRINRSNPHNLSAQPARQTTLACMQGVHTHGLLASVRHTALHLQALFLHMETGLKPSLSSPYVSPQTLSSLPWMIPPSQGN
jgi:hypothetical protein